MHLNISYSCPSNIFTVYDISIVRSASKSSVVTGAGLDTEKSEYSNESTYQEYPRLSQLIYDRRQRLIVKRLLRYRKTVLDIMC
jgi:hypothetical protein